MFEMSAPAWSIATRNALVFLAVFVGLRLMGKREIGPMTVFDLVLILLITNSVQSAMVGPDLSVQGGILAAFVLLLVNQAIILLRLRGLGGGGCWRGRPRSWVEDGRFDQLHLRRERLDRDEVDSTSVRSGGDDRPCSRSEAIDLHVQHALRGGSEPLERPAGQVDDPPVPVRTPVQDLDEHVPIRRPDGHQRPARPRRVGGVHPVERQAARPGRSL